MAVETFKPGPTCSRIVQHGKVVGHISLGGSMLLMPVGSRTVLFEMHGYFGPIPCSKKTEDPLERIPVGFWDAYERWDLGDRLVDGETCIVKAWCRQCKGGGDELLHLGGRHYQVVGRCKACNGARLAQ